MTTPDQIKQWMKKMGYIGPVPSDEALQRLCRGVFSTIFQQIIEKFKPRQEIEFVKQNILINRIQNKNSLNSIDEGVEQLKLYNTKKKLEKELHNLKELNHESDISLEHIISKLTTKNAKIQSQKAKILKLQQDCVLFRAKCCELDQQVFTYEQLYQDSLILDMKTKNLNREEIDIKLQPILLKLSHIIEKNPQSISAPITPHFNDSHSFQHHFQTSDILSSTKKAFSTAKRSHRMLHSSHTNRKPRNLLNFTFETTNNSTITSNSTLGHQAYAEKYSDIMHDLETSVANDSDLTSHVKALWKLGCADIFKAILERKIKDKKTVLELLSENWNRKFSTNMKQKEVIGMDKLYNFHIKHNLERLHSEKAQRKCLKMIEAQFRNDIHPILALESTEFGLQNSIIQFEESCKKFQFNPTTNINNILFKIQELQTEMLKKKTKIESNLCLLYNCNSWLKKIHENVLGNMELQSYPEHETLKAQIAQHDLKNFTNFPLQSKDHNYMNNWTKVYDSPELLEIIQHPYLAPEHVISAHISESNWLQELLTLQSEICTAALYDKLNVFKQFTTLKMNNVLSFDKLNNSLERCRDMSANVANLNSEIDIWLDAPLNQCAEPKIKFENKYLSDYVTMYDEFYKTIAK